MYESIAGGADNLDALPSWFLRLCWMPPCRCLHGTRQKKNPPA